MNSYITFPVADEKIKTLQVKLLAYGTHLSNTYDVK